MCNPTPCAQAWEYFEPLYQSAVTAYVAKLTVDGSTEQLFLTRFVAVRVRVSSLIHRFDVNITVKVRMLFVIADRL